jgi:dihydrolipoamide dehydrogenase
MALIDIKVPDIGDFKDVAIIELLVKPGDTIKAEQSLITVESDKASMEIPSSHAGVVKDVKVKVGDTVNEGTVLLSLEASDAATAPAAAAAPAPTAAPALAPTPAPPAAGPAPASSTYSGTADTECDLVVLGAGPGGYSAAFRAADLGMKVVLIERYPTLGGVCLNVGCIPSKALLHVAAVMDEAKHFAAIGVDFKPPAVDLDKLRTHKEKVVAKLTGGLAAMAKMRKVTIIQGSGEFLDPYHLKITLTKGGAQTLNFKQAIIAAGSEAVKLPFMPKDDPRVMTSTGALELRQNPKNMLIIGGGIIGLEMGTVYSTLGARLDVVEMLDGLMQGADRDLVKVWQKLNAPRFDNIMLKTKTVGAQATKDGILVKFETVDGSAPAVKEKLYDLVPVDIQMRTNVPHIFAVGDIVGQPMLEHKAVHEAHVAAEVAAGDSHATFEARVIPSVAYTDPEVAWVGVTEDEAKAKGIAVKKGLFPWNASGRAIANLRDEGFTKLLFDEKTHAIVGGAIVGTRAGDMIGEIALAIEMGADAIDIGKTIHPHPTLGESIGLAAEAFEGVCTDLPPVRR